MERNERMLSGLNLDEAVGIEIGALDRPILPRESPRVFFIDHLDTEGLRAKYREDPNVNVDAIVNVGGVWGQNTLAEAAGPVSPVDFIVASHVIEHVPDLIGWLNELASVLKEGGEVRLAIPDRRYTFDLLRRETRLPEVLEAHLTVARVPAPGRVLDAIVYFREVDRVAAWDGRIVPDELPVKHSVDEAVGLAQDILQRGTYYDVHCWVFTPDSFCELMLQIAESGYAPFSCASLRETEHYTFEFLCVLRKTSNADAAVDSWRELVTTRAAATAAALKLEAPVPSPIDARESASVFGRLSRWFRG